MKNYDLIYSIIVNVLVDSDPDDKNSRLLSFGRKLIIYEDSDFNKLKLIYDEFIQKKGNLFEAFAKTIQKDYVLDDFEFNSYIVVSEELTVSPWVKFDITNLSK